MGFEGKDLINILTKYINAEKGIKNTTILEEESAQGYFDAFHNINHVKT